MKVYCNNCIFRKKWDLNQPYCSRLHERLVEKRHNEYTGLIEIYDWTSDQTVYFNDNYRGRCSYYKEKPSWVKAIKNYNRRK